MHIFILIRTFSLFVSSYHFPSKFPVRLLLIFSKFDCFSAHVYDLLFMHFLHLIHILTSSYYKGSTIKKLKWTKCLQNFKMLVPTHYNWKGIRGGRNKNVKALMSSNWDIKNKITLRFCLWYTLYLLIIYNKIYFINLKYLEYNHKNACMHVYLNTDKLKTKINETL